MFIAFYLSIIHLLFTPDIWTGFDALWDSEVRVWQPLEKFSYCEIIVGEPGMLQFYSILRLDDFFPSSFLMLWNLCDLWFDNYTAMESNSSSSLEFGHIFMVDAFQEMYRSLFFAYNCGKLVMF